MRGQKLLQGILAALVLSFVTAPAFAVMSLPYGWYLEGNVGSSSLSGKSYPGASSSSSGIGYSGNLGYKFMPYVAVEAGYTRFAETDVKNGAGTKAGTDKHFSWDIALKGIAPVYDSGFEAFAKLGIQRISSDASISNSAAASAIGFTSSGHSKTGLYMGIGAQYYFMPEFAVVAQWARSDGNSSTGTSDLLSAGLSFMFG